MLYPVNEIFTSIQGEGYWTGRRANFIRLSGCNLKCDFCDTDHSRNLMLEEESILRELDSRVSMVVITGGEPLIHDLGPLIEALRHLRGRYIAVETNGVINPSPAIRDFIHWITVSPKPLRHDYKCYVEGPAYLCDELKVVVAPGVDPIKMWPYFDATHLFVQPCSGNVEPCLKFIEEHPEWRLSLQVHKILNLR